MQLHSDFLDPADVECVRGPVKRFGEVGDSSVIWHVF
jgi:hypothetical protein